MKGTQCTQNNIDLQNIRLQTKNATESLASRGYLPERAFRWGVAQEMAENSCRPSHRSLFVFSFCCKNKHITPRGVRRKWGG